MALADNILTVGGNAMAAVITHVSLHTAGAVTSSTSESAAARRPVVVTSDADGDLIIPTAAFTGGAASGAAIRIGYWSALTVGTYYGGALLTGDQAFNAAGAYTYNGGSETSTAT